jgi:gliding motility-associated-like protein
VVATKPTAAFDTDTAGFPVFVFHNTSTGSPNEFVWSITYADAAKTPYPKAPPGQMTTMEDWVVDLKDDTGKFEVCLIAIRHLFKMNSTSPALCPDTVCHPVNNIYTTKVIIPNVFTPNNDGANDFFKIDIEGETKYDLMIFNRWGTKVFMSDKKNNLWNGKDYNTGGECPSGTYFFVFSYKLRGKDEVTTVNGTITLIRPEK